MIRVDSSGFWSNSGTAVRYPRSVFREPGRFNWRLPVEVQLAAQTGHSSSGPRPGLFWKTLKRRWNPEKRLGCSSDPSAISSDSGVDPVQQVS